MNFDTVTSALQRNGYAVSCFETGREAAAYLNSVLDGRRIGCGGSATLQQLGLIDSLAEHNRLFTHTGKTGAEFEAMLSAELRDTDVYLTSANALAETGELVNIDGNGNRVASTLFGHQKVYFILGRNKIAPTLDAAIWRARNVAAPKKCPAAPAQDALRGQGRPLLRLQFPGPHLQGSGGAVAGHGHERDGGRAHQRVSRLLMHPHPFLPFPGGRFRERPPLFLRLRSYLRDSPAQTAGTCFAGIMNVF